MHSCVSRTKINKASIFWILNTFRTLSRELLLKIELADKIHEWAKMSLYTNKTISRASIIEVKGEEVKNNSKKGQNCKDSSSEKMRKTHPMVPPLDHLQGKNKNGSSLARRISASRRSFFANLTTFERRSGLKIFSLFKIAILKMGWLSKFQSHRSWGDAHLSFGAAKAPPN